MSMRAQCEGGQIGNLSPLYETLSDELNYACQFQLIVDIYCRDLFINFLPAASSLVRLLDIDPGTFQST
jgi:hypothetical protein